MDLNHHLRGKKLFNFIGEKLLTSSDSDDGLFWSSVAN